jgi:hypothetical protein
MICEDIRAAMGAGEVCEETEAGARVATHCLYPSFDPVTVLVSRLGDGYRVSDAGGAVRNAWISGRDEALSGRMLAREAARYSLSVSNHALVAEVPSIDWLRSAVLAVANASASVAHAAIGKAAAAAESHLKDRIRESLEHFVPASRIDEDYEVRGQSGDSRHFDYGVRSANDSLLLLSAVSPHHNSIAAKYVAFADTKALDAGISRFAVYDRPLEKGSVSLMLQVAELVPLATLDPKARRVLALA